MILSVDDKYNRLSLKLIFEKKEYEVIKQL